MHSRIDRLTHAGALLLASAGAPSASRRVAAASLYTQRTPGSGFSGEVAERLKALAC